MSVQSSVSLKDVRGYLKGCEESTVYRVVGILKHSLRIGKDNHGRDQSAAYVVRECEKIDPNSPLVRLLKENESAWPQVMKTGDEVIEEMGLNIKTLYE